MRGSLGFGALTGRAPCSHTCVYMCIHMCIHIYRYVSSLYRNILICIYALSHEHRQMSLGGPSVGCVYVCQGRGVPCLFCLHVLLYPSHVSSLARQFRWPTRSWCQAAAGCCQGFSLQMLLLEGPGTQTAHGGVWEPIRRS